MKKEQSLKMVGLIIPIVIGGLVVNNIYKDVSKPAIERITGPNTPVWRGYNEAVCYVDRRSSGKTVYYWDNSDGQFDAVFSESPLNSVFYWVVTTAEEAEKRNRQSLVEKRFDGQFWVARDSSVEKVLQDQYSEVRLAYQRKYLKAKDFPENKPKPVITEEIREEIRQEKLKLFRDLLAEYRQQQEAEQKAGSQQALEIAHLKGHWAFLEMRSAYHELLNQTERKLLFVGPDSCNFPRGIKLDVGEALIEFGGISLLTGDPHQDFENFLKLSYMEIDYQSAFSVIGSNEWERIRSRYFQDLRKRGLKILKE